MTTAIWIPVLLLATAAVAAGKPVELFVAPGGDDGATGTRASPLRSLAGARDRVRAARQPDRPVTVWFAAGRYPVSAPVRFGKEDSGTPDAPVVYRAAPGAAVRFSGGAVLVDWSPVTDPKMLQRLPAAAREHVVVADLAAAGVTDTGTLAPRGFGVPGALAEPELFCGTKAMTLARWPNEGFRGARSVRDEQHVEVDTDRPARWADEPDPWLLAYWKHDWAELFEPLAGVEDGGRVLVRSTAVKPRYGISKKAARWYAFNLLSELDRPGEYVIDRNSARLYFWPPDGNGERVLSQAEALLQAEGLAHVTFRGFTIEAFRGTAITIRDGSDCHIVGCTVRDIGGRGIRVEGGARDEVFGCDIYETGAGGIAMRGGDRATLTAAKHNVENNHVYRYARRERTYHPAIRVDGVGNRIAHNLVHDGPHMALAAGGNEHVVEYNEVHNVVEESGDAGAYYVGRDWTQRGTVLRFNYWHEIAGATGLGGMTIYLDDQFSGTTIQGNLFEHCSRAVFIGGGVDNVVTNNVFVDCAKGVHLDNRGMTWQRASTQDPDGTLRKRLAAVPFRDALWRARYPTLPGILEDAPGVPKRNVVARNVSAGGRWDEINSRTRDWQVVRDNLAYDDDPDGIRLVKDADGRPLRLVFKDPAAVAAIGFVPLPLEKMGLYRDERRASWPVEHTVRPVELPRR